MNINPYTFFKNIKWFLIVFLMLMVIIQSHIFSPILSKCNSILLLKLVVSLMNPKIKIHGNVNNLNKPNLLIMSNHYDGVLDVGIINNVYYKHNCIETLHTIAKDDLLSDETDKSIYLNLLCYLKQKIFNSFFLIPYKRGNKEDGKKVKNIITETIRSGKNIFIFPEGTSQRNGIPVNFKHGIFQLAVENKLNILPITIKCKKDYGVQKGDSVNFLKIFDNEVDIYIHETIDNATDDCFKSNDAVELKNKVFNIIREPFGVLANAPA
jgi:1-acyl-sn-glycerol-3-phosphate acyltransferase